MTEKNISEKLGESISNLIKKTNTFEKAEAILKGISLFMFFTGAVTLFNSYKLHKMDEKINKILKTNETIHLLARKNTMCQKAIELQKTSSINYEINKNEIIDNEYNEYNEYNKDNEYKEYNKDYEDNELLNECYDIIPCNNSKKVSGLNKLFGWK